MNDPESKMIEFMRKYKKEEKTNEDPFAKENSEKQIKKKNKIKLRKERLSHIPSDKTPDTQNKEMKKRTPQIRKRSHNTKPS